jgi:hypothetical protein
MAGIAIFHIASSLKNQQKASQESVRLFYTDKRFQVTSALHRQVAQTAKAQAVRLATSGLDASCATSKTYAHMHRVLIHKAMTSTLLEKYAAIGVVGG